MPRGLESPLRFDLDTVQATVLRLLPGITEAEIAAWMHARAQKPFSRAEDFRSRSGVRPATIAALRL
jgi:DNA uptake protein ComE-like DNA-binding protein